ncbi:hypothetical protein SBOR_9433 [Sclerotinia borealis F-4128]|uniref:Uncharacterized protein n=1 Tax=Sclerotinia borealis (strain F-4128) TaxID=1432307 RepID=W9C6G9_SCLBF|nr:hypothetical protein SBOR_9433 [Sclerotinia borealis F-4128]
MLSSTHRKTPIPANAPKIENTPIKNKSTRTLLSPKLELGVDVDVGLFPEVTVAVGSVSDLIKRNTEAVAYADAQAVSFLHDSYIAQGKKQHPSVTRY